MEKWPCLDCAYYDTFDNREDGDVPCRLGHAVTHMSCDYLEPFSLASCNDLN